ncbi:MAG: lipoate--protein ligase family protein [Spirochaetia bacterium]|nr:lipoate--protein ligase family protein [Spirochaetia bacterium]
MAYEFRLLKTGFHNAFFNMGLDEAILESVAEERVPPTLRFYGWEPHAISIGYFQGIHEEVNLEACREKKVDVVRRITGGGAVFHAAEVTYSIVIPESHPLSRPSILDSYRLLCSGIIEGLSRLGIEAEFAPINDIIAGGRKISGNAQTRKKNCILQHGTILLSVDVDTMFSLLKVPQEKARGKLIQEVKARVTSIENLLGKSIGFDETARALEQGFSSALDLSLSEAEPTEAETIAAARISAEKFSSPAWTFKR